MSLKWQRSKRWDDEHFPAWAWPAKFVLRAFSSITLAVFFLVFVMVYATLASVPIGLLVLGLTYLFYAATFVLALALLAILPTYVLWRTTRPAPWGLRFTTATFALLGLGVLAGWIWLVGVWPALRYEPLTGEGVRFFPGFVEAYKATTLRRLPGIEMTELEFYGAWPLRIVLLAFVVNMIVATVRRIEFVFPNLGVLTVHTGIVVMALGSIYYGELKQEGMAVLRSGMPDPQTGDPSLGPPTTHFYDNIEVSLYLDQGRGWEQRVVRGVPRYNDYNLDVVGGTTLTSLVNAASAPTAKSNGPLNIVAHGEGSTMIDDDLDFRIVGYASYAEPIEDWVEAPPPADGSPGQPARVIEVFVPSMQTTSDAGPAFAFALHPRSPARRATNNGVLDVEYRIDTPADRWRDLAEPLAPGTRHAIVVELPGVGYRGVHAIEAGETVALGDTGFSITADQFMPQPPFRIITPGYEGAASSVAVLTVSYPDGRTAQRWAYHRYPEISQDFVEGAPGERPTRKDADPSVRIAYLDDSHPQIYIDERDDGSIRAIVREATRGVYEVTDLPPDARLEDIFRSAGTPGEPRIDLALAERWANSTRVVSPRPVPVADRNPQLVGSHDMAMVAVEVSDDSGWSETAWVQATGFPLARFGPENEAVVTPPGRTPVRIEFGARQRAFPGFAVQLADFEMIAYDHRGAPRDYQSTVRVSPVNNDRFEAYTHLARLNAPLQAPFMWDDDRPWLTNAAKKLASRLNPNQFKLSQARWDAGGWEQTQAEADQGLRPRPFARWTILGVGNNPGIHIIALGGILIGVGTPWAFYVKPLILRARKRRIQAELAAGRTPTRDHAEPQPEPVGASS